MALCTDGTWRLSEGPYCLLTLGALVKEQPMSRPVGSPETTTYKELLFCLCNKEGSRPYEMLFKSLLQTLADSFGLDESRVTSISGDFHRGLSKAIKTCLPRAARIGDFAHLVGANRGRRSAKVQDETPEDKSFANMADWDSSCLRQGS